MLQQDFSPSLSSQKRVAFNHFLAASSQDGNGVKSLLLGTISALFFTLLIGEFSLAATESFNLQKQENPSFLSVFIEKKETKLNLQGKREVESKKLDKKRGEQAFCWLSQGLQLGKGLFLTLLFSYSQLLFSGSLGASLPHNSSGNTTLLTKEWLQEEKEESPTKLLIAPQLNDTAGLIHATRNCSYAELNGSSPSFLRLQLAKEARHTISFFNSYKKEPNRCDPQLIFLDRGYQLWQLTPPIPMSSSNNSSESNPMTAILDDNRFAASWNHLDQEGGALYYRFFTKRGEPIFPASQLFLAERPSAVKLRAITPFQGGVMIGFHTYLKTADRYLGFFRFINATGAISSPVIAINPDSARGHQAQLSLLSIKNEWLLVTYEETLYKRGNKQLMLVGVDPGGSLIIPRTAIIPNKKGQQSHLYMQQIDAYQVAFLFTQEQQEKGNVFDIYFKIFNLKTHTFSEEKIVNRYTPGRQKSFGLLQQERSLLALFLGDQPNSKQVALGQRLNKEGDGITPSFKLDRSSGMSASLLQGITLQGNQASFISWKAIKKAQNQSLPNQVHLQAQIRDREGQLIGPVNLIQANSSLKQIGQGSSFADNIFLIPYSIRPYGVRKKYGYDQHNFFSLYQLKERSSTAIRSKPLPIG